MKLERIKVGKITSPVGIKGEVKVYPYTDYLERFEELEELQADGDIVRIEKVRYKNEMVILKFEGIDDRNAAEVMRNKFLTIGKDELRELDEDKYYIFDLIGLEAVDQEGHHLGTVTDVIQNSAQDLYEITADNGKINLVPAVYELVTDIDINNGIMKINLIEGLFDNGEEIR